MQVKIKIDEDLTITYDNFQVIPAGVIVPENESDPDSGTGEYFYPWHKVEEIYSPTVGVIATLPL